MATITANVGAQGNWTAGATWQGGIPPTAADDAVIPLATVTITIDAGAVCRSADFNTFTGVLTMGATGTLTLGDATAGAGNVALNIPAGATFVPNAAATFTFISTSATLQTISISSSYSMCIMTFNSASNGNYALIANLNQTGGAFTLTKGTLQMDGTANTSGLTHTLNTFSSSNTNVRALNLGTAIINISGGTSWDVSTATSMTLTAGTSSIRSSSTVVTFQGGASLTYYELKLTGLTTFTLGANSSGCSFTNLSLTGTAAKTNTVVFSASVSVTGIFTLAGNSVINRLLVRSTTIGSSFNINNTGVTHTWSNIDFRDITLTVLFNASAISGGSGNCGGCTNITFTTAVTRYAVAAGNFSSTAVWSATDGGAPGATAPLPQDIVNINANSGVGTITFDMLRFATNISFAGYLGTAAFSSTNTTTYGNLTWGAGMTIGGTNFITFEGRSSFTITSNGKTATTSFDFQAIGGTYTLQDAFATTGDFNGVTRGTFNANNFNVTAATISISSSATRSVTMGTGTWTATGTGNVWNATTTTGLTFSSTGSMISLTDVSGTAKTFIGGGLTYDTLSITGGGAGSVTITGANTFFTWRIMGGTKSIVLPGSTTTTLLSGDQLGNDTNVITFTASAGSATISKTNGILTWNYVSLTNIPSTGGATFYAGANSTDGGGNTGWIFTSAPEADDGILGFLGKNSPISNFRLAPEYANFPRHLAVPLYTRINRNRLKTKNVSKK